MNRDYRRARLMLFADIFDAATSFPSPGPETEIGRGRHGQGLSAIDDPLVPLSWILSRSTLAFCLQA